MVRCALTLLLVLLTGQAFAETCPDFYRFVDFGLEGNDGVIYRGGTTLRAESFEGEPLLITAQTKCISVPEVAKDGHGNPIPVVKSINYLPEITGLDLNEFRVSAVDDTELAANENAKGHKDALELPDTTSTRSSSFLCANSKAQGTFSCQLVSPYPGNIPLVVYCDAAQCEMPVLAVNQQLQVSASWTVPIDFSGNPEAAGTVIQKKVQQIHDFLKPLSSAL